MDIFLNSNALKALIIKKINTFEYDYVLVAAKIGVEPARLNHYLSNYEYDKKMELSHEELLTLCDLFNIKVTLKVEALAYRKNRKLCS